MKLFYCFFAVLSCTILKAQADPPDCRHLVAEHITLSNAEPGMMEITLSNSCTDCSSGIDGPVYCELVLVNSLGDTLGASRCYCLVTPVNGGEAVYLIQSYTTVLPSSEELRVMLNYQCDDIPIRSVASASGETAYSDGFTLYPNPVADQAVTISREGPMSYEVELYDLRGVLLLRSARISGSFVLDLSGFPAGLYIVGIRDSLSGRYIARRLRKD